MVVIFVLLMFSVGQFTLTDALLGRDRALDNLRSQIAELSAVLSLERTEKGELQSRLLVLTGELASTVKARDGLAQQLQAMTLQADEAAAASRRMRSELAAARARLASTESSMQQQAQSIAGLEEDRAGLQAALRDSRRETSEQEQLSARAQTQVNELNAQR